MRSLFDLFGRTSRVIAAGIVAASIVLAAASQASAAEEVNVYSYRQPYLVQPLFDGFTADPRQGKASADYRLQFVAAESSFRQHRFVAFF